MALLLTALFAAAAGFFSAFFSKPASLDEKPVYYSLLLLIAAFSLCWLPVLLSGGFVQDDWMVLSAAAIRKIIYLHPSTAWFSLDTVNGNFRPLVTSLYFGYMFKIFGLQAFAFLCGNFIVNLLGSIVAFFLVRELGYTKTAGFIASLLYMTRSFNYTLNAWACALGDGIVILLGGVIVLMILRANKRGGFVSIAYHALAWVLFVVATFAKQSSFSIPLIVALLLLLRPGQTALPSFARRVTQTVLALITYSIPAAIIFFHARSLLQKVPYPIVMTLNGFTQLFGYITWYFIGFELPGQYKIFGVLTSVAGAALLVGLILLVRRVPALWGKRPRDIVFLLLASLAAISLYIVLPSRTVAYYGAMSAFYVSIAIGIAVTQLGGITDRSVAARNAYFALYLIVIAGFLDIRIKQTGLISSGGYIWGTYGVAQEKILYGQIAKALAISPADHTLVMVGFPEAEPAFQSMALIANPGLQRILRYDRKTGTYLANNLEGFRPKDNVSALSDLQAYWWNLPIDIAEAAKLDTQDKATWIELEDDKIRSIAPLPGTAK